jgi:regulator of cell morphogenesis and NO signaling
MMTLSLQTTVGEIAAKTPASVRVFEKYGIDFCCGGSVGFEQACQARGADPAGLMQEIEEAERQPGDLEDWSEAGLGALIDHIITRHHTYLKTNLPRIQAMLDKVVSKHSSLHGAMLETLARTFAAMKEELEAHLMKEEMILFPMIRALEEGQAARSHCGFIGNPIRVMLMEHDSAGSALAEMRRATSGYSAPETACNTFRALFYELEALEGDLHLHIHLENNVLFPRALSLTAAV